MPNTICVSCGKVVYFRNTRGSKMPKTCPSSNGELTLARWAGYDEATGKTQYEAVPHKSGPSRRKVICAVCGKRRYYPSDNAHLIAQTTRFARFMYMLHLPADQLHSEDIITVPAGVFVCWHHEPVPEADHE